MNSLNIFKTHVSELSDYAEISSVNYNLLSFKKKEKRMTASDQYRLLMIRNKTLLRFIGSRDKI